MACSHTLHANITLVPNDLLIGGICFLRFFRRYRRIDRSIRAGFHALTALNTKPSFPKNTGQRIDGFGIMTPFAFHRAAFQVNIRSKARSVIHCKSLNLCYERFMFHGVSSCFPAYSLPQWRGSFSWSARACPRVYGNFPSHLRRQATALHINPFPKSDPLSLNIPYKKRGFGEGILESFRPMFFYDSHTRANKVPNQIFINITIYNY